MSGAVAFSYLQDRSRVFLSCSEKWPLEGSHPGLWPCFTVCSVLQDVFSVLGAARE